MKKYSVAFIFILLFADCKSNPKGQTNKIAEAQHDNAYPKEIESLALQRQYDNTKWYLYCMYCDQELSFLRETNIKEVIKYGTLPLKFQRVIVSGDSIEINFFFQYKDEDVNQRLVRPAPDWGVVHLKGTDSAVMYSTFSDMPYYWLDPKINRDEYGYDRHIKLLQPEVIKYIRENKDQLDPWFRNEAIKRGVINE